MTNDDLARKALDEVANGMQSVTALSTELRRSLGGNAEKAIELEAAVDRVVRVLKQVQPRKDDSR